jgi:tetratricopeptide (TPR) repeat protein
MVTAPVVVFLYDRTFLAGSFRQAWRRRRWLYLGLAATWVLLAMLLIDTRARGDSVGFSSGVTAWQYALTQCTAIVRYVRLSFWPSGLCFDYGVPIARTAAETLPGALLLLILASATFRARSRRAALGFLGMFFLATLAPTSSFVPIGMQTIAEHRMYLSLAAVIAVAVVGGDLLLVGVLRWLEMPQPRWAVLRGTIALAILASATAALGVRTRLRNEVYRTDLTIWEDTLRQRPMNPRAHNNLGSALAERGLLAEAIAEYQKALEIKPEDVGVQNNLGSALADRGQFDEAINHYRKGLQIKPDDAEAHNKLGSVLFRRGQIDEAIAHYQKALDVEPDYAEAHNNLGTALFRHGRPDEAIVHYQKALDVEPNYALAHNNLGIALAGRGCLDEAVAQCRLALEIKPGYAEAHYNLGNALLRCGNSDEAIAHYKKALEIQPNCAGAHNNLGIALAGRGQVDAAIVHCRNALEIQPDFEDARRNLAIVLSERERILKALTLQREALRSRPNDAALLNDTAWTLATNPNESIRNGAEAVELAERASHLSGDRDAAVLDTLAAAYAEAGRFPDAVKAAKKAIALARDQRNDKLAGKITARLSLYGAGCPYRDFR